MDLSRSELMAIAARMPSCGLHSLHDICFIYFDKSRIYPEDMPSVIRAQIDRMCASASYKEMIDQHWDFRSSALLELTTERHHVYKCFKCLNTDLIFSGGKSEFQKEHRWMETLWTRGSSSSLGATAGGADLCRNCA